jgi:hypothetical protein
MLTQLLIWLNRIANAFGAILLAPVQWLPGWFSATLIGVVTGVVMLIVFKYTSNQSAIKRTRDQIKANMLALSLFRDNLWVSLRCQSRLLFAAVRLVWHALVPMAVLAIPMILILGQLALWYQARPLDIGEESIMTVQFKPDAAEAVDSITLSPSDAATVVTGPVRVPSKNMVCWNVMPTTNGRHVLNFTVDGRSFEKELVVGGAFQPTSLKRPSRDFGDLLLHPREPPFDADSIVQSIEVTYPKRNAFTSGTNTWVIYWFIVSMIAALAAKPLLNVHI